MYTQAYVMFYVTGEACKHMCIMCVKGVCVCLGCDIRERREMGEEGCRKKGQRVDFGMALVNFLAHGIPNFCAGLKT